MDRRWVSYDLEARLRLRVCDAVRLADDGVVLRLLREASSEGMDREGVLSIADVEDIDVSDGRLLGFVE